MDTPPIEVVEEKPLEVVEEKPLESRLETLEARLAAIETQLTMIGANNEHRHDDYAEREHSHSSYAVIEHNHEKGPTEKKRDRNPEPIHPYFKRLGS